MTTCETPELCKMSSALPLRLHDDPDEAAQDEGENDDDEEDVDDSVGQLDPTRSLSLTRK